MTRDLDGLAREWLSEKQTIGSGMSVNTEQAYRRDLTCVAELLTDERPALQALTCAQLTRVNLRDAFATLARTGYAPASRTRSIGTWKAFCQWLLIQEHLVQDPMLGIDRPRKPETLPVAFTVDELNSVLVAASTDDPTARKPWPARDRALVAVLGGAGLRASEVCTLKVVNVERGDIPALRVTGKGSKTRIVPIPVEVLDAIDDYLDTRVERFGECDPGDALFLNYSGRPLTRESLKWHAYSWFTRAGVHKPEQEAVHVFRHTYAKGLVSNGVDIKTVQTLLGHARITSTEIYLRMTATEVAEAIQVADIRKLLREQ